MINFCNHRAYTVLANAIIKKAADDYRKALRGKGNQRYIKECEAFFKSEYFKVLTNVDGIWLMNKLREEVKKK